MNKEKLNKAVGNYKEAGHDALQIIHDTLNPGQRKQVLKNEKVKYYFDIFGVEYEVEK